MIRAEKLFVILSLLGTCLASGLPDALCFAPPLSQNIQLSSSSVEAIEEAALLRFFRLVDSLEKEAKRQSRLGRKQRSAFLSGYIQDQIKLTPVEAEIVKDHAHKAVDMLGCRPHLRESAVVIDPKVPERGVTATDLVIQFRQTVGEPVYEKLRAFWQK